MATVRKPSSLAARKMRMAISLRLAASSLRIGFTFLIMGRRGLPKFYTVPQPWDEKRTVFSMHQMQRRVEPLARLQFEGAALPRRERGVAAAHVVHQRKWHGLLIRLEDTRCLSEIPSFAKRPHPRLADGTRRDQRR